MLKPQQTQKIYAMAARLGLVENGNKNDLLHDLVYSKTEKTSVRELTETEYKAVVGELAGRLKVLNSEDPPKKKRSKTYKQGRNGITEGQQKKVWQCMYELAKYDTEPSTATLGQRLCGIIKKEIHIDASVKDPMCWLSYADGSKLIEKLKKYIENAKRRKDGVGR